MLTVACCTRQLSFLSFYYYSFYSFLFFSFARAHSTALHDSAWQSARALTPSLLPPPPAQGVAHRDLKPENILLATAAEDAAIKITDFGLSRLIDDSALMTTACGTPG